MKNIAKAERPKSAGAMLSPRPLRGSGKVVQTTFRPERREGNSCIPTLNQTFADSRILKIPKFRTFRIAEPAGLALIGIHLLEGWGNVAEIVRQFSARDQIVERAQMPGLC